MNSLSPNSLHDKLELVRTSGPNGQSERQRLEQLWTAGRLAHHCQSLEKFYQSKREEIEELKKQIPADCELLDLAKLLILENIIVDHIAETKDQIREIEAEIWIQGEQGNFDRNFIASEWARRHAAMWREWRIKEYLFAVERMEQQLKECLGNAMERLEACPVS